MVWVRVVVAFLLSAISVSAEVYDVTTVYRIAGNITPITETYYNSRLDCDGQICDWDSNGWRQFETMPDAEGTELYVGNNKLLFPVPSKNFGISFHRPDTDKVFIYLLPEDDINALYMTIIVLKYTHEAKQAHSKVLICPDNEDTDTLSAVELPNGNSRQCRTVSHHKVIPYITDYNINFIRGSNSKIYLQSEDGTNLQNLYLGFPEDVHFIAIQSARNTKFSVKPIYRVTKLSKLTGILRSPVQEMRSGQATCLTVSYYLKAVSRVSLFVYVETNDKKLTKIGTVNLEDDLQDVSKIHQFIWYSRDHSFMRYRIVATRTSENDIVLIKNISGCHSPGYASITTINKQGSCEVQGRSNALGLPLQSSENVVVSPNLGSKLSECYAGVICNWTSTNWIRRISPYAPLYSPSKAIQWQYKDGVTPVEDFFGYLQMTFTLSASYSHSYSVNIFLLDSAANIQSSNMYVIKLHHGSRYQREECYIVKCFHSSMLSPDRKSMYFAGYNRFCEYLWRKDEYEANQFAITEMSVILTLFNSELEVNNIPVLEIENSSEITKVCFTSSSPGTITLRQDKPQVWTLPSGQGILRSPTFINSDSDKICISITYYVDDTSDLHLQLETAHQEILEMANVSLRNSWTTERKIFHLQKENEKYEIQVVLVGKTDNKSKIMVQRIAGCNVEEQADIVVLSNGDTLDVIENVYHVAIRQDFEVDEDKESKQCINGGIFDTVNQGCICPAGFGGPACEIGCGINTFGASCDGICSETLKGCKEMIFCHAKLGCNCATGLQGALCSSTCELGYYGAGCTQECGNCKSSSSSCNIYTGHCLSGCLEGYYPPFCKEHYKHFTRAPKALTINPNNVTVTANLAYSSGKGRPIFYQFQYIESNHLDDESPVWLEIEPLAVPKCEEMECVLTGHVIGLTQGKTYHIRAVLLDEDGSSYHGQNIPHLTVTTTTNCTVPKNLDYKLWAEHITESSFHVLWEYIPKDNWCSLKAFSVEFRESSRWTMHYQGTEQHAVFTDMWYGREYKIRVSAITIAGVAAYSDILVVKTKEEAPHEVREIKVTSIGSKMVTLEWTPPSFTTELIKHYVISYKCLKLLACKEEDCSYFSGEVKSSSSSVTIANLMPFAQYSVSVAAFGTALGPAKHVLAATATAEPQVAPSSSFNPVLSRTNTTITVQWEPPHNCSHINGFLHGYLYQMIENPFAETPVSVLSDITSVTFSYLTPLTEYTVKVFVINSVGWNPLYPLIIKGTTSATTPDMVRNLTVYKHGRRMIGFRWNAPKHLYGDLESYTVSYQINVPGSRPVTTVVKPTPCPAWPMLYCHTFSHLQPDSEYTITVSARNTEVNENGEPAYVTALTKERAPAEPLYLKVVAANETSLTLEWGLPDMINGLLRSFLLSVEGTDSYDSNECCQFLPLQEVVVIQEKPSYQFQVTGLQPASTYSVSVSGKTISLGPSVSISAHTRPALPKLDDIIKLGSEPVVNDMPVIIKPVTENKDLVSAYLLIVITENPENVPPSVITDEWLNVTITEELDYTYYVAGEYTQEDLEQSPEVLIGTGSWMHASKLSTTYDPELQTDTDYFLAVAVVLDYCGVKNVGISTTSTFRIDF